MRKNYLKIGGALILGLSLCLPLIARQKGMFEGNAPRVSDTRTTQQTPQLSTEIVDQTFPIGKSKKRNVKAASSATNPLKTPNNVVARALGDGTILHGFMLYSSTWSGTTGAEGLYTFPAGEYQQPQLEKALSYDANGGGCYGNGKFYYNSFVYTEEMGYTFTTFCTYDLVTEEFTTQIQSFLSDTFNQSQITNALAFDPTTNQIFAVSYIKEVVIEGVLERYYPSIGTQDIYTGVVSPIARTPEPLIAIACNKSGMLYGVSKGQGSKLYLINKDTGDCTEIGTTGLNPEYIQSMTFDPVTDKLYWAEVQYNGSTGLYEVNTTTGAASKICDFQNNEEYGGLFIPEPTVADAAPAAVTDLNANFPNGALSGKVTLTVPSKNYAGGNLSGNVTVKVSIDGSEVHNTQYSPGASVSFNSTLSEGVHSFAVTASNASGDGPRTGSSFYIGLDAPAAVGNLTLQPDADENAFISWTAPTIGRHDGYIDPTKLTYKVVRMPDNAVVAQNIRTTNYTDVVTEKSQNYYYIVTPYCDGREGVPAETSSGLFGKGTSLPAKFDFSTEEQFDLFTKIDANGDADQQYHWGYWMWSPDFSYSNVDDPCAIYGYHPDNAADDWLITPPIQVVNGKKYTVKFTMWTRGDKENLEVTAGPRNTVEAQRTILASKEYNHTAPQEFTQEFIATETGNYYCGFHITSPKKRFYLYIDDIEIDEVPDNSAPAAVSNLTATEGARGAMNATISFTAPTKTVGGTNLTLISKIDIYRDTEATPAYTFTSPTVGSNQSWTDNNPDHGFNTYRVVAYAGESAGAKAEATCFVGYDIPVAPTDVVLSDANGVPTLTWTAPTEGQNGGYVNPDELTYSIYRLGDEEALLTRSATGTTYQDTSLDGSKMQYFVYYEIVPVSQGGMGEYALSDFIVYGDPYKGEFSESFSRVSVSSNPWLTFIVKGNNQLWNLYSMGYSPTCNPVDNDGGLATFESTYGRTGDEGRLVSPKIDISSINNPVLSFWMYHCPTWDTLYGEEPFRDRLIPEIQLPDGTFVALDEPLYVDDPDVLNGYQGWVQYAYDLSQYKNYPYICISMHGIADYEQDVNIDLIEITNLIGKDLQLYNISAPSSVKAGRSATIKGTIYNRGSEPASGYQVALKRNGSVVETLNGNSLNAGSYSTVPFEVSFAAEDEGKTYSYTIEIIWDEDEITTNNTSRTADITVTSPVLPEVESVTANAVGRDVTVTWGEPNALKVSDSFEEYAAFSIDNIGDYTLVDGDKANTWGFSNIYFENTNEPQSFMVFNPYDLGIVSKDDPIFNYSSYDPRTGRQVLACFQAVDVEKYESVRNDDWFISPEVHGGQTIVFYAKAGDYMQGSDNFEVMYSTTDKSTSSFVALSEVITTGKDWEEHKFTLPQNAKYFAIHCVSDDDFILFIDDLDFVGKYTDCVLPLTGFRILRNGMAVADMPADARSFTDTQLGDGNYTYGVYAIYGDGRLSAITNAESIQIGKSGIETVNNGVNVTVENRQIVITCPDDSKVTVTDTSGVMIYTSERGERQEVNVASGIYLVTVGNSTYKIIVR